MVKFANLAVGALMACAAAAPAAAAPISKSAPASAAASRAARSAHPNFNGAWASLARTPSDGLVAGAPITLRNTDWAPLSAGRPEDRKAPSYEQAKALLTDWVANNKDVFREMAALRKEPQFTPAGVKAAEALQAARGAGPRNPYEQCLPRNTAALPASFQIFQTPDRIAFLSEDGSARVVYMDGLDRSGATPTYLGTSIGHWEGDRLVVVTGNFLGDTAEGWPASPKAKVTEALWLSRDRKLLSAKTVYSDPTYMREPMAKMTYLDRQGAKYEALPVSCVETVQGAAQYEATFGAPPK
jgi:hypothetical protein